MQLQDIFFKVLSASGQFNLPQDKIELKQDNFLSLVKTTMGYYNRYAPFEGWQYKSLMGLAARQYVFTVETTPTVRYRGMDVKVFTVPLFIADLVPVRISGTLPYYMREQYRQNPQLDFKTEFTWEYRAPILTLPIQGEYDLRLVYNHQIREEKNEQETQYYLDTIDDSDYMFFNLLTGKFMQSLGRSRKAFTLSDLPITTDAAEMVSDGKSMEEEAKKELQDNMKFYLAWRP